MIGRTISHYRIVEKLGEGGMGVVYVAEDTLLGRRVAIKTLTAARGLGEQHFRSRFLREARAISKLSHPHIATIYDYGEIENGQPYIVMELVKGSTLGELMRKEELTIPRSIEIIKQVAEALAEAHRHGIIHRDIKPSNIAINERGSVKVLDFGLAKEIEVGPSDPEGQTRLNTQTREGVIVGTPTYLSPEQALGVEVDARSDLFSLGGLLYECIAGRSAFSGKTAVEVCAKVIRDDPPPPSEFNSSVSPELDRITLKALAKRQEARYQTAGELINDLDAAQIQTSGLKQTGTQTIKAKPSTRSSWARATVSDILKRPRLSIGYVLAGLVAIGAIVLFIWWITRERFHQPTREVQRQYDRAVDEMHQGAFFRASKMLEQVILVDDSFALAHARVAEAYTELDYSDKAKEQLFRARELVPNPSVLPNVDALRLKAVSDVVMRDFTKAITDYQALVLSAPSEEKHHAITDLGRAYEKNDQPDKAIESYEEAIKRDSQYAAAFLRLGVVYGRRQRSNDALNAFDEAYKRFEINGDIEGLAEVELQRAVFLGQQLGKVTEAREELLKALEKTTVLDNQDKRIKVLLNLSYNYTIGGEIPQAQQYTTTALSLAQQNKMEILTAQVLIDLGNAHFAMGNYAEAEKNFNDALRLAQFYKGGRSEARAFLSLASLSNHQNDPDAARDFVNRALPFYQQGGYRRELSQAYSILGHALDQAGDYSLALQAFQQQLDLAQKVGDQMQIASSHEGLGVVLNHIQDYPAALVHFNEQYKIVKDLNNNLYIGYSAMNRGTMLWQLGYYYDALAALEEASSIAEKPGAELKELVGWVRVSRARLALSKGDSQRAISESRVALKTTGTDMKAIYIQANSTLCLAQSMTGNTEARSHCQEAVESGKTLRDPLPLSQAWQALAQAALNEGDAQTACSVASLANATFAKAGQLDLQWRNWLVQAIGSQRLGDQIAARDLGSKASQALADLQVRWGYQNFLSYSYRPDVTELRKLLDALRSKESA